MAASDRELEKRLEHLERLDRAERFPGAHERFGASLEPLSDEELGEWFVTVGDAGDAGVCPWDYPEPTPGYERWKRFGGEPLLWEAEELFSGLSPEERDAVWGPGSHKPWRALGISDERWRASARASLRLRREREDEGG